MAVPNTNDFSLQDVVNEINPSVNSLQTCFNEANASGFDPTYEGSKNQLSDFRNYSHTTTLTAFSAAGWSAGDGVPEACTRTVFNNTYYHDGIGTYPGNGDAIYLNGLASPGNLITNTTFRAANGLVYTTNASGQVIQIASCGGAQ